MLSRQRLRPGRLQVRGRRQELAEGVRRPGFRGQHADLPAPTASLRHALRAGHRDAPGRPLPGRRRGPVPVEGWGGSWQIVNAALPLLWPKDFTVDPADGNTIYIGAADAGGRQEGGLYRTADGGAAWTRLARKGPEHFGAYLHPRRRGWVYMTLTEDAPGAGLWLSKDGGATWAAMAGLPFANAQRVAFDPANDSVIYVTTFGGSVWRGPASE